MTTPISSTTASLSGLASGLNTSALITALMSVAEQPMTNMQNEVTNFQADITAWNTVSSKLTALQTAVFALKNPSDIAAMAVAGSSSQAVDPVVTGSPAPGSMSFTVDQLATTHQLGSASTFGSASDLVGAGTFSITMGGTTTNFTTTSGTTLGQLAQQISSSNAGVAAAVVAVNATTSTLVLTSTATGAASAFTASGTQASLSSFNLLQQGQDAKVTIGTGANAVQLSRSSNQINDLMPGVSLNLLTTSATPVTVTVQQDVTSVVKAVQAVVSAYNDVTTTVTGLTSYDATTQTAGQLMGDSTAQALLGQLNDAMSSIVSGLTGNYTSAASIGITIQQDGTLALNQSTLFSALTANPNAVTQLLSRSGTATDARVASVAGTDFTQAGTYGVVITQAATAAGAVSAAYGPPPSNQTFTVTANGVTATVTLAAGDTESTAVGKINAALSAAGLKQLIAQDNGAGAIQLQDSNFGSGASFTVAGSGALALDGTYQGTDVAGTINGVAATGAGQTLFSTSGASNGLTLQITATPADVAAAGGTLSLGTATLTQGIMGRLSSFLNNTVGLTGTISDATNTYNAEITDLQGQMADLQVNLDEKQTVLQQQFAAMESALVQLQSQSAYMAAQFGSSSANNNSLNSSIMSHATLTTPTTSTTSTSTTGLA